MRSNYTLTITVNAPDRIGCTDIDGDFVLDQALDALEQVADRTNRVNSSDVRVDRAGATVVETEAEATAPGTGGVFQPLDVDNVDVDQIASTVNALGEAVARLTALAERAERYLR